MVAYLSLKSGNADAQYFVAFIPSAVSFLHYLFVREMTPIQKQNIQVSGQDHTYKTLLAVYNALYYWGARPATEWDTLRTKRLLLAVHGDEVAAKLLKKAKVDNISESVDSKDIICLHSGDLRRVARRNDIVERCQ